MPNRHKHAAIRALVALACLIAAGCDGTGNGETPLSDLTYYVSPGGDDSEDGFTRESAFETIAHALDAVLPGDTVVLLQGTYDEELRLEERGSPDAPITIRSETDSPATLGNGDEKPTLDGTGSAKSSFWITESTNIIIDGLEVTNYTDAGILTTLSSNITIRNCTVHDNGKAAVLRWAEGYGIHADDSQNITIENNDVYGNGPSPQRRGKLLGTGINCFNLEDSVIRGNRSHHNVGGGILVEDSANVVVERNEVTFNDLDATAEEWWDGGIWVDGGHDITVRNNTFRDNLGPGIEISDEGLKQPYGYVLENNISTNNYYGIYIWNFGTSDFPPDNILKREGNQISGNARQDIWIVPWECPEGCD